MGRKKTVQDYHRVARQRNFEWVGGELPQDVHVKTVWRCQEGHKWEARYSNIRWNKTGCPHCANKARKILQDYGDLAQRRRFEWLGEKLPRTTPTKTSWKCSVGHEWETTYDCIQQGTGCPYCSGKARKTEQDYYDLAQGHGFLWLGKKLPKNNHAKTLWKCPKGHEWEAPYARIQQGSGCPLCVSRVTKPPKTIDDYHDLAKKRGFKWIGEELPRKVSIKTHWKCSGEHKWEACYNNVQQGNGCPTCVDLVNGVKVSKPQRQLCKMLNGELNYPFSRKRIDVALPNKMIAIEYDCWFWHGHKQEQDVERDGDLLAAGWKVLHIKTNVGMPSRQELDEAIAKLENGERQAEIVLDDWGKGLTFAEVRAQKKVELWESSMNLSEYQQIGLW